MISAVSIYLSLSWIQKILFCFSSRDWIFFALRFDHHVTKFSKWLINMLTMKMVRNDGIWYGRLWISSEFCLNILQRKISTPAGIKTEKCNQNFFYNFCLQFLYHNMTSIVPNKYFLGFIPDLRMLDICTECIYINSSLSTKLRSIHRGIF